MMKLRLLRRFIIVIVTLFLMTCFGCTAWSYFMIASDSDFVCFENFFPSQADISKRVNIIFPDSMSNLKWQCHTSLDREGVSLRFTISASDADQFAATIVGYWEWQGYDTEERFFTEFNDHPESEQSLVHYRTWAGATDRQGEAIFLMDMDDPEIYTVYVIFADFKYSPD